MTETKCVVITGGAEKPSRRPKTRRKKDEGAEGQGQGEEQKEKRGQAVQSVQRAGAQVVQPAQRGGQAAQPAQRGGQAAQPALLQATPSPTIPVTPQGAANATPLTRTGSLPATALTPAYVTVGLQTQQAQAGGVVLKPRKTKVTLQPHRAKEHKNTTRKIRRVVINTKEMVQGMTRVKHVHKDANTASIDFIKRFLVEKGIIQPSSRAPSSMLRSMYADCNIIRDGKAL